MLSNILKKLPEDKDFFEIIRGTIWSFGGKVVAVLLGLLLNLLISRYYGVKSMGEFALINSFFSFALIFSLIGTDTVILRLIPEYYSKSLKEFAINIYFKILLIVILFSFFLSFISYIYSYDVGRYFFHNIEIISLLKIASLFIIVQGISTLNVSALRAFQSIKLFTFIQILNPMSKIIILLILTSYSINQFNPVYTIFISFCVMMFISLIFVYFILYKEKIKISKCMSIDSLSYIKILNLSIPMFLTSGIFMLMSQIDIIMIGAMKNVQEVGIYSISMKLAALTSFILGTVNTIVAPKFSELYHANQMDKLEHIAQQSSKLMFWSSVPIIIIFLFFGKFFLSIFGNEYIVGYMALIILIFGQFLNATSGSVGYFLNMTGYQKELNIIILVSGFVNILLNYCMIAKYGINGAAFASSISLILWNFIATIYIKKKFGFYIGYIPKFKLRGSVK